MSDSISLGAVIYIAVKPIIKIYLILFVGWLLVKYNMLSMETSRGISNIVVNAILPCLSFNKIVANLSGSQIKEIGVIVLSAIVIFTLGGVLAYIASLITPVPKKWKYGLLFAGIFGNISDLPMAYVQSMGTGLIFDSAEADKGIALSCIFLATQSFLMMNVGMFQIVGLDFRDEVDDKGKEEQEQEQDKDGENFRNESYDIDEEKYVGTQDDTNNQDTEYIVQPLTVSSSSSSSEINNDNASELTERRKRRRSSVSINMRRIQSHESYYSTRSRHTQHQNLEALINEYSEADIMRTSTIQQLAHTLSKTQEVGLNIDESDIEVGDSSKDSKWNKFVKKHNLGVLDYIIVNLVRVPSITLVLSLIITMIPWLRSLFVHNSIDVRQAPDNLPVLNFVMDATQYIGNAAVPMALMLLGGTIARLEIREIPKGYWKTLAFMIPGRLILMPIIGILWANKLYDIGWIEDDISRFLLMITWSVPSATAQVYFTALYTPLEGDHIQMDCLAIFLLAQYPVLIITLAIVVSYVLKVSLGV